MNTEGCARGHLLLADIKALISGALRPIFVKNTAGFSFILRMCFNLKYTQRLKCGVCSFVSIRTLHLTAVKPELPLLVGKRV